MTDLSSLAPEKIVKSEDRVRGLGEVFTPRKTVDEILNSLPRDSWEVHPARNFFEPSCGDGNFLVAILERKLASVIELWKKERLPAGMSTMALAFHSLEAASSIYGVDISKENVMGGRKGQLLGARHRLLEVTHQTLSDLIDFASNEFEFLTDSFAWVYEHNVLIANMLPFDAFGNPTKREAIPLVEYEWRPSKHFVKLSQTTFGQVLDAAETESTNLLSLFGDAAPSEFWNGHFLSLHTAMAEKHKHRQTETRNANGRSIK